MNKINLQQTGGFPLETDTLNFMQDSYVALQSIARLGGENYILSGCEVSNSNVNPGFMVIKGEVLPFLGGPMQSKVVVIDVEKSRLFENGVTKPVYLERTAQFGTGASFTLFSELPRIKELKEFRDLPHQSSSAINSDREDVLATSKAVKTLNDLVQSNFPKGGIIIWSGSIKDIPVGWALCDGNLGRPNLRDRFVLGAGNDFPVNAFGGARMHQLTIDEMPRHSHGFSALNEENGNDAGGRDWSNHFHNTTETGGNQPHNNMPPYFALAYIIKL